MKDDLLEVYYTNIATKGKIDLDFKLGVYSEEVKDLMNLLKLLRKKGRNKIPISEVEASLRGSLKHDIKEVISAGLWRGMLMKDGEFLSLW